ncbi:RES domain-containing protein [Paracoccus sp. (in: a-proteobacteria)]|uniref:RES domain-containing protein n=1 Tax=Paracoccus sp. TaxID=267 RepID=UPI003A8A1B26
MASLTAEGAALAIQSYLGERVPRLLVSMRMDAKYVADERGNPDASIVWQDIWRGGSPSPTWVFSDAARKAGAQAMLYSSRSRPEIAHVVVLDTDCPTYVGPTSEFNAERPL